MKETQTALPKSASRIVLAIALASSSAIAQQQPGDSQTSTTADTTVLPPTGEEAAELPPVTVSAHDGHAVPYDRTGVSVSIIDTEQKRNQGITTLSDALTDSPGAYILPGGGDYQRGNTATLTIRGLSGDAYTMPMIDGMRLTNTSTNLTENLLARLNLFDLGQVEILRGSQGAVYGGSSMSGVIYMETPKGQGDPSASIFNEAGSFDSYTGNLRAQGASDKLALFFSSTYTRTNNDLHFADGSAPTLKHAGKYENWQKALRADYAPNEDNTFTVTYRREDAEYNNVSRYTDYATGLPADSAEHYTSRSNLLTAKWSSKITDTYSTSLMAGYYGLNNRLSSTFYTQLRNVQVEWRNAWEWNEHHTTTAGFAWQRSEYSVKSGTPLHRDGSAGNLENTYNVFAEHSYSPIKSWDNSLALRLENSSIYGSRFTFRAASSYRFNREKTRLIGSVGTGYRAPSSFQHSAGKFVGDWGTYYGNPTLDCETSISADLGIEQKIARRHTASATLFWQQKRDAIQTIAQTDPATWLTDYYFANSRGIWTIQGIELALQGTLEETWKTGYRLACTLTQPLTETDAQIPDSARQTWSAELYTSPIEGLTTGLGLVAATGRSSWQSTANHLDGFYTLRWFIRYEVNEHLTLHLRIENLTNQKYVTSAAYDSPANSVICTGPACYGGCPLTF